MGNKRSFPLMNSNGLWLKICKPSATTVLRMEENHTKEKLLAHSNKTDDDTSAKNSLVWCP